MEEKVNKTKSNNMIEKADKIKSRDNYVSERMQAIQHNMLGTYNKQGEYVINDRIVSELIALKKVCKDAAKGEVYCTAKTKSGRLFNFQIRMNTYPLKNECVAKLYLMEDIERLGGKKTKTVKTKIAKFTDEISDNFFEKAIDYFNVIIDEDDKGQEVKYDQVSCSDIEIRSALNKAMADRSYEKFNDTYQRLFNDKFFYLRNSNSPFARAVLAEFMEDVRFAAGYYYKDPNKRIPNYAAMYELLTDKISEHEAEQSYRNDRGLINFLRLEEQIGIREEGFLDGLFADPYNFYGSGSEMLDEFGFLFGDHLEYLDGDFGLVGEIFDNVGEIFELVGDVFEDGIDFIKDQLGDAHEFLGGVWDRIVSGLGLDGAGKLNVRETNGLYMGREDAKFTNLANNRTAYSDKVVEQINNGVYSKPSIVSRFGEWDAKRDAEKVSHTVNTPRPMVPRIKPEPFQESKIKQSFEIQQHTAYDKQTDMTLNSRIAQMGQEMSKIIRKP